MKQLESGSKEIIKWNKYQSKVTEQKPNRYLDYIVDLDFQEVNRLFVLSFEKKKKNRKRSIHRKKSSKSINKRL